VTWIGREQGSELGFGLFFPSEAKQGEAALILGSRVAARREHFESALVTVEQIAAMRQGGAALPNVRIEAKHRLQMHGGGGEIVAVHVEPGELQVKRGVVRIGREGAP
jgi:hypothetical protein